MDPLKARDLRTLSHYLRHWMSQPEIDALYPEPPADDNDSSSSEDSDSD